MFSHQFTFTDISFQAQDGRGILCSVYQITLWTNASGVVIIMLHSYYRLRVNY